MNAPDLIARDLQTATRRARRAAPFVIVVGVLISAGAWFGLSERSDDLPLVVAGLGGLVTFLGAALLASSFRSVDRHPLILTLRDRPEAIQKLVLFNVHRNNAFVAIRMEFYVTGGAKLVYQEPRERAESWLHAIFAEHPRLRSS